MRIGEFKTLIMQKEPRKKKCRVCKTYFTPRSSFAKVCGPICAHTFVVLENGKKERLERQKRLQALKTKRDYTKEAQIAFNAYIRLRDHDKPCICCGRNKTSIEGLHSHGWDCGHFRSVGSAPHLRFNPDNAHRQLVLCNRHGSGRAVDYRLGLIARIGIERVEALESDNTIKKWTIEELIAIRDHYRLKTRELKKMIEDKQ